MWNDQELLKAAMPTGARALWCPLVEQTLDVASSDLPPSSQVLEIGYGNGMLACYAAKKYGWQITGYDISKAAFEEAKANAKVLAHEALPTFKLITPTEIFSIQGKWDAVLIKTVLYDSKDLSEYQRWIDWIKSVLKPSGTLINFENGKGSLSVNFYRRIRRRIYRDRCLFNQHIEKIYRQHFDVKKMTYHGGGFSWMFANHPLLYHGIENIENLIGHRHANNSFVVSVLAKNPRCQNQS